MSNRGLFRHHLACLTSSKHEGVELIRVCANPRLCLVFSQILSIVSIGLVHIQRRTCAHRKSLIAFIQGFPKICVNLKRRFRLVSPNTPSHTYRLVRPCLVSLNDIKKKKTWQNKTKCKLWAKVKQNETKWNKTKQCSPRFVFVTCLCSTQYQSDVKNWS